MDVQEIINQARDAMTVRRVFGDPYEKDGLTIIPAARVSGGAGGGAGNDAEGSQGSGAGYGLNATPVGAYVIKDGVVTWQPAIDLNRAIMGAQLVMIVMLLALRAMIRARAWAQARGAAAAREETGQRWRRSHHTT